MPLAIYEAELKFRQLISKLSVCCADRHVRAFHLDFLAHALQRLLGE
eukprot:COSAG01_NODE_8401_length_2796_cov_8.714498_3_plen_47_part_00